MNRQGVELLVILAGIFIFILGVLVAWLTITWFDLEVLIMLVGLGVFILIGIGFAVSSFLQVYIMGPQKLAEEVQMIMTVNPTHRVKMDKAVNMKELAAAINVIADRFQSMVESQEAQIQQAQTSLKDERNKLLALISELSEGILVCNLEGQILLYNDQVKQLLEQTPTGGSNSHVGGFVGLGRSVFGLIDRNAITHAVDSLLHRRQTVGTLQAAQFVVTATNGQLIKARMAPVLNQQNAINGFILNLEDVTRRGQASRQRYILFQSLTEGVRSSLANIRAAIETIEQFPEMDETKLTQLRQIILEETLILNAKVNETTAEHTADLNVGWRLEEMLDTDLLWAVQHRFEKQLKVSTSVEAIENNLWLKIDSYSIVLVMTYIMRRLKDEFGITEIKLCLKQTGNLAAFDLAWQGGTVDMGQLWSWQHEAISNNLGPLPLSIRDVAEAHGGEVWCQTDKISNTSYFRLLLPTTPQPKPVPGTRVLPLSRPEYYDFDLFQRANQTPELDQCPLTELTYTVFDTETTGLNPSQGDEIISVSAVRIVNGRLLRQEVFDQLVDPCRSLPRTSTEITGISPEMLVNQPTIKQVLPVFFKFAEGTVLVAHNAAFDMRLLQLKEDSTGIRFTNPVLDTLLLSAVAHPQQSDHSLEAIAERLGINVIGRHTSLGDAILTGEVFLKLIPLLAEKGISTLAAARDAAQETYLARISY